MTHLETYLDCLKLLPNELQRELVLMGELDRKATAVRLEMEAMQEKVLDAATKAGGAGGAASAGGDKKQAAEQPTEAQLYHIRQLQQALVDLHNEKLALAKQSRDMVLGYADRLEYDMQLFAADLDPGVLAAAQFDEPQQKKSSKNVSSAKERSHKARKKHHDSSDDDDDSDEEEDEEEEEEEEEEAAAGGAGGAEEEEEYVQKNNKSTTGGAGAGGSLNNTSAGGGGSASPTESAAEDKELYCICQQPSYGEMVGCDNETCPYEWFHFSCVGLKKQPKGQWICDECKSKMEP